MGRSRVNVAIVGVGYWGKNLLRTFGKLPGACVTDVCDMDEERLAACREQLPGIRVGSDYPALLARDDVDAVIVATPPSRHHRMALDALDAGKHVWVEKPLALAAAEGRELVDAAAARGRVLFVDETFLYDPLVREMKNLIDQGVLGEVYHLSFERLGMGRIRRDSSVWWNSAPHDLAILFHLVPGRVIETRLHQHAYLQTGIADMATCDLELEGGISAHVYLSWLHPEKTARVTVVGSRRMLTYEGRFEKRGLTLYDYTVERPNGKQNGKANGAAPILPISHFSAHPLELPAAAEPLALAAEHFVDCVATGREPLTTGARSLRVVEVLEAADHGGTLGEERADRRGAGKAAAFAIGAVLLALLLYHAGLAPVVFRLRMLGWGAPLVLLPYALIASFDAFGWRCALPNGAAARVPFGVTYLVRMAGEAVNSLTPTAVTGEPIKAMLLRPWGVSGPDAIASIVIAKTALTVSQIFFILLGLAALFDRLDQEWLGAAWLAFLLALSVGFSVALVRLQRRGPAVATWRWLRRLVPRAGFVARLEGGAQGIDERLADFYRIERGAFFRSTLWHLLGWLGGVVEVVVLMRLVGTPIGLRDALLIEALAQPIRAVALVIPGGLGAQEIGGVALCRFLGIPEAAAVTLWLLKRARELAFDGVGLAYLARATAARRARAEAG